MASATLNEAVTQVVTPETITLTLDRDEANLIRTFLGHLSMGDEAGNNIRTALNKVGVRLGTSVLVAMDAQSAGSVISALEVKRNG